MNIATFHQELRQSHLPVVVDVWAPWCAPCRMIEPALHTLSDQYSGRVDVWKINADENGELLRELKIYGIPSLLVYRGEQEVMRSAGAQPQSGLERLFEAAVTGDIPPRPAMSPTNRLLRLGLGLAIVLLSLYTHQSWVYLALGGVILFSAVYDRCPVWQALSSRFSQIVKKTPV